MLKKTRKTTEETKTGGNKKFIDLKNLNEEQRKTLVRKIKNNKAPGYHILKRNGKEWPRSDPDRKKKNNLDPKIKKPKKIKK